MLAPLAQNDRLVGLRRSFGERLRANFGGVAELVLRQADAKRVGSGCFSHTQTSFAAPEENWLVLMDSVVMKGTVSPGHSGDDVVS